MKKLIVATCLAAAALLAGCAAQAGAAAEEAVQLAAQEAAPAEAVTAAEEQGIVARIDAMEVASTREDLQNLSDAIVLATFTGESATRLIQPAGQDGLEYAQYFTDWFFTVDEELYGAVKPADLGDAPEGAFAVRMMGGGGDGYTVEVADAPQFEKGATYLLFLDTLTTGAHHNTADAHYYLVSTHNGAWASEGDGIYVGGAGERVSIDDLRAELTGFTAARPTSAWSAEGDARYIDELAAQLAEGQIEQELYDEAAAAHEREVAGWSQILGPEDEAAYLELVKSNTPDGATTMTIAS